MKAHVTSELVLRELRGHNFAVVSVIREKEPPQGCDLAIYVMTPRQLPKVRNSARNPNVLLVIPRTHS